MPRLAHQISEALTAFADLDIQPSLIGGLALSAHRVVRATQDVVFIAAAEDAARIHHQLLALGYQCAYRSDDAANYLRGDEGLDLLYARRPIARRLLLQAQTRTTSFGTLRVISAEGLIGFKLQAFCNNPKRLRDLDDIRALLQHNRGTLDLGEVRRYFTVFDRETLLDELLTAIG